MPIIDGCPTPGATCDYCDGLGTAKTYRNQVAMPVAGKVVCVDNCIHRIVAALNAANVRTVASCCGHKKMLGRIDLWGNEDERTVLLICNREDADRIERWYQPVWQARQQK